MLRIHSAGTQGVGPRAEVGRVDLVASAPDLARHRDNEAELGDLLLGG